MCLRVSTGLSPPPEAETSFFFGGYPGDPAWSFIGFGRQCYPWLGADLKKGLFWKEKGAKGDVHERNDDHGIYVCVGVKKNKYIYIYIYVHMLSCNYIHMYIFVHRGIVMGHFLERVSPPKCQTNRSLKVSKSPRVTTSQQSLWKHHISRPSAIPTEKFHGYPFCPFKSKGNPSSHLKASGMTMTSTVEATPSTGPFLTSLFLCQVLSLQCRMLWCLKNRQIVESLACYFGWDPWLRSKESLRKHEIPLGATPFRVLPKPWTYFNKNKW